MLTSYQITTLLPSSIQNNIASWVSGSWIVCQTKLWLPQFAAQAWFDKGFKELQTRVPFDPFPSGWQADNYEHTVDISWVHSLYGSGKLSKCCVALQYITLLRILLRVCTSNGFQLRLDMRTKAKGTYNYYQSADKCPRHQIHFRSFRPQVIGLAVNHRNNLGIIKQVLLKVKTTRRYIVGMVFLLVVGMVTSTLDIWVGYH